MLMSITAAILAAMDSDAACWAAAAGICPLLPPAMIVDVDQLDQLRTPIMYEDPNSPEVERVAPPAATPLHAGIDGPMPPPPPPPPFPFGAGSAPPLSVLSTGATRGAAASAADTHAPVTPRDQFAKVPWPEPKRTDSTPSLMSQQLSEWSTRAPPIRADVPPPTHRRCRSEGVGFQSLSLTILLPPIAGAAGAPRAADSQLSIAVPAFYSVAQTIVAALHECRRRLPSAAWRDLEGAELVLRITEDGEPQFDLPALAAKAAVIDVGESELALCAKADPGPWRAQLSDGEAEELRRMMGGEAPPGDAEADAGAPGGSVSGGGCILS